MSKYGCCTLSSCNWRDKDDYLIEGALEFETCDDCPYYDPHFFEDMIEEEKNEIK